jgi:GTP cyclohydrolase II
MKVSETARFRSHYAEFNLVAFEISPERTHLAAWLGDISSSEGPLLLRLQSACTTGTALAAAICDCGDQVRVALTRIPEEGRGLFLYLDEEARGHGLQEKVNGMAEMNRGASTVTAYTGRGLPADKRTYSDVGPILNALNVTKDLRVMTNNPKKLDALADQGFKVMERIPLEIEPSDLTYNYLLTKKREFGHIISVVGDVT